MKIDTEANQDLRFELKRMDARFTVFITGPREWEIKLAWEQLKSGV